MNSVAGKRPKQTESSGQSIRMGSGWPRTAAALAVLADEDEAAHELGVVQLGDGALRVLRNRNGLVLVGWVVGFCAGEQEQDERLQTRPILIAVFGEGAFRIFTSNSVIVISKQEGTFDQLISLSKDASFHSHDSSAINDRVRNTNVFPSISSIRSPCIPE